MQIKVESLSFSYEKNRKVLDEISFDVDHAQVVGILGSSGCGKSTLLRIICGVIPNLWRASTEGVVSFEKGFEVEKLRSKGGIGLMFQEPSLLPNRTVEQNIRFPLEIIGEHSQCEVVEELIDAVGLQQFRDYLPKHLSGGMQTRTALARTFVTKPSLLLLDEPFAALDYGWKMDLYEKLSRMIKTSGSTVILVSHDIREVLLLGHKILLLSKRGKIAKELIMNSPKPVVYKPELLASFFDEVKNELVFLENYFLDGENF